MTNKKAENQSATPPRYRVTKKDLRHVAYRWNMVPANLFNYETQQGTSFGWTLAPLLRKIYPNDDEYQEALLNHFNYYNATPQMTNLVLGAVVAMEQKDGIKAKDTIQSFKTSIMGPLSGIGDTVFWVLWPTIIGSISGYMALKGNPLGAIIWLIVNILIYFLKIWFVQLGYTSGTKIIDTLGNKLSIFTDAASITGLAVIGALIATVVKISTPVVFEMGKVKLNLQTGVFDQIMPCLLPMLLTVALYKLFNHKRFTPTRAILLIIALSLIGTFFGIFKS
ncbi:PTS system mannose/fructose/sorbose family transporter subunit IID [Sporolactobacillus shoreicorticis]|uniref:PTS system mannose/fructose/sorbose family transporter subunit IID n=1 Tax=Sporolactobacillus shoreicorticis TaxID=1923877 RepID=A0ABW5S291_9BACL|nr:PTS system mannose/fructose/sorbose family transporter subunit IID [Sporolactobacillus shoreicorticis]MCO7124694.1 PTS system mannose/fructose/sorbose family transporter subunit IID [Sporolactobacillus shoreicorticis]